MPCKLRAPEIKHLGCQSKLHREFELATEYQLLPAPQLSVDWRRLHNHPAIARKRATRSSVAGCVLNRLAIPPPDNGFMILLSERLIATITGKKKSVTN